MGSADERSAPELSLLFHDDGCSSARVLDAVQRSKALIRLYSEGSNYDAEQQYTIPPPLTVTALGHAAESDLGAAGLRHPGAWR